LSRTPRPEKEIEVAVLRAQEHRIDKAMETQITAARFSPSTVITARILEN
jgi:hypothetical protein